MNTKVFIAIVVIIIGVGGFFVAQNNNKEKTGSSESSATVEQQSAPGFDVIETALSSGGQLLDVRTPEEYGERHIQKAINLPLDDIEQGARPSVDKNAPVYVYCRSGNRSAQAKQILDNAGFTNVVDLGSIEEVIQIGGTTI